jgi:hypothetical protein
METFDFISSVGWRFYVPVTAQKQISGISNKMFTNRQGIRKGWLISRKIFPLVPKVNTN